MGDRIDHTWGKALGPWRAKVMTPAPRLRYVADLESPPAPIGHNGGPALVDSYVRAHAAAWKAPPRDIALFRLKRAQAAGVDYHTYMLALLDTGRHLQAGDAGTPAANAEAGDQDTAVPGRGSMRPGI